MSNNSFKVKNALTLTPVDVSTLLNPQSGDLACDSSDSNKIKRYDSVSGTWKEVGSGAGGVSNVNALLTQTFETASLGDFTQTGLSIITSGTINGSATAKLTHAGTTQSFKQVISADRKYRGQNMTLSLSIQSTATQGNVTLNVYDETNAANIVASEQITLGSQAIASLSTTSSSTTVSGFTNAVINTLSVGMHVTGSGIPAGTFINSISTSALTVTLSQAATATATVTLRFSDEVQRRTVSFLLPANCSSLSYTVSALAETGSPETYVDDVVIELTLADRLETSVTIPNSYKQNFLFSQVVTTGMSSSTAGTIRFGAGMASTGDAVLSYDDSTGRFTALKECYITASASFRCGAVNGAVSIFKNAGIAIAYADEASSAFSESATGSAKLVVGDYIYFNAGVALAASGPQMATIEATSYYTTDTTIPLTQSGLVQDQDGYYQINNFTPAKASTNTTIYTLTSPTITANQGDHILHQSSSTLGDTFTATKSGVYTFAFTSDIGAAAQNIGLSKNSTQLTTAIESITAANKLCVELDAGATTIASIHWTGSLVAGDVVRIHGNATALSGAGGSYSTLSIVYQGSLKQVAVSSNQKIAIPTSELRFEGASSRGAVATAIVKFDTLTKLRGDAFTVTSNSNDGTYITMNKAGKLDVSANTYSATAGTVSTITKNQAILTSYGSNSEIIAAAWNTAAQQATLAGTTFVNVGDVIRVASANAITGATGVSFNLSFQEQNVQVSVSNTLPQFSDSDLVVRAAGNSGQVITTNVTDVPFTTVSDTTGGAWTGSQFVVPESGEYKITGSTIFTTATQRYLTVYKNGVVYRSGGQSASNVVPFAVTDSFSKGDVISFRLSGGAGTLDTSSATIYHFLNINKTGKPNVTGIDVTPFTRPTLTETQAISASGGSAVNNAIVTNFGSLASSGTSIVTQSASRITANKKCIVDIAAFATVAAAGVHIDVYKNGIQYIYGSYGYTATAASTVSASVPLEANEYIEIGPGNSASTSTNIGYKATVTAVASAILTAPEVFSTDTTPLTYASSSQYTLSTLSSAPVGTFITYTYAASSNTRTQTTTAPTQTTANMNQNGISLFTRVYASASTAASPTTVAIQIGKGMKGVNTVIYKNSGKDIAGSLDLLVLSTAQYGVYYKEYNESTGVLFIDVGVCATSGITTSGIQFVDNTFQNNGCFVINASKNPALCGLGLQTVAARGVSTSGQSIPNVTYTTILFDAVKSYDTHGALNAATGIFTAPESGFYQVSGGVYYATAAWTAGLAGYLAICKNGATYANSLTYVDRTTNVDLCIQVSSGVYLAKGDTLQLKTYQGRGSATALYADGTLNYFSIHKTSV